MNGDEFYQKRRVPFEVKTQSHGKEKDGRQDEICRHVVEHTVHHLLWDFIKRCLQHGLKETLSTYEKVAQRREPTE